MDKYAKVTAESLGLQGKSRIAVVVGEYLGASRGAVFQTIMLPYLKPALIGAGAIAFLMSFENFNTTLMLVEDWFTLAPEILIGSISDAHPRIAPRRYPIEAFARPDAARA